MYKNKVIICGVDTSRLPVMKESEKEALLKKSAAGDRSAREELINGNLRLVLSVIQRFAGRGENPDDLFQVGCIGLIKSIDNFDVTQKVRFSTYAVPMIIGEIRRYLRDNNSIRVSRSIKDTAYKAMQVKERLAKLFRTDIDISDNSPGWKFAQYEMKGVPLRLEIGPKDIEQNQCVIVRRDNREKTFVSLDELGSKVTELLQAVHDGMYEKALQNRENRTWAALNLDELIQIANEKSGFIKAMWCGDAECEAKLKEVAGVSSRCMPFAQEHLSDTCVCCGKPAKSMVIWGKAY